MHAILVVHTGIRTFPLTVFVEGLASPVLNDLTRPSLRRERENKHLSLIQALLCIKHPSLSSLACVSDLPMHMHVLAVTQRHGDTWSEHGILDVQDETWKQTPPLFIKLAWLRY